MAYVIITLQQTSSSGQKHVQSQQYNVRTTSGVILLTLNRFLRTGPSGQKPVQSQQKNADFEHVFAHWVDANPRWQIPAQIQ